MTVPAPLPAATAPSTVRRLLTAPGLAGFLLGAAVTVAVTLVCAATAGVLPRNNLPQVLPDKTLRFEDLLALTPDQIAKTDIAVLNLACAEGLPGAENLNARECLDTLDRWAGEISAETEKHLYVYRNNPGQWGNSEHWWRVGYMARFLTVFYGTSYNPELQKRAALTDPYDTTFFRNSADVMLHGLLTGKKQGTCPSIPVLVVAVGRRMGYPLKLVRARGHCFARWDDPKTGEKFNIEATDKFPEKKPDSFYRNWPTRISDEDLRRGLYLQSLTPTQELAEALAVRGLCLWEHRRYAEAQIAFVHAHALTPDDPYFVSRLWRLIAEEDNAQLKKRLLEGGLL